MPKKRTRRRDQCAASGKVRYKSREEAIAKAEFRMVVQTWSSARPLRLYVYPCDHCKDWHLTRSKSKSGPQPKTLSPALLPEAL